MGMTTLDEELAEQLAEYCEATPDEVDERLSALNKCLGRLEEKDRQLIEHRYSSASTLDEYATQSGRPVGSLRVSLFRIRAALRNCINGQLAVTHSRL
jgi:RNA polymerase sigma-70 factor (ECF subfamily)